MKKISAISSVSLALLLLTFFIFLFLAIRPDPDDMIISLDVREHSLYYALKMRYLLSSFRTTLILSEGAVLGGNDPSAYSFKMFLYFALSLMLLVYVIYGIIKEVFRLRLASKKGRGILMSVAMTITGATYFLCSSRIEVFGWLGASASHLIPMIFVLMAILVLLRALTYTQIILLTLAAPVIAGGAEHINSLVILMNIYLLFLVFKRGTELNKFALIYFSVLHLICFVAMSSNPGVWHRVHDVSSAQAAGYDAGNFFLMFFQPYKIIGIALAFFAAVGLKHYFKISVATLSPKILLASGLVIFCVCFMMGLAAYHSYNIGRIWLPFDLFLVFCFIWTGLRVEVGPLFNTVLGILLVLIVSAYCYKHIPALHKFRKGYDDIVHRVISTSPGTTVVINGFPEPDLVNLVELDEDPDHELNALFCRFYGSKVKISVQESYSKSR